MRRSMAVGVAIIGALAISVGIARAQGGYVAGGLTALPTITEGPNKLQNPGFETMAGGTPAGWSTSSGWAIDQLVHRGGSFSYRRGSGAPSAGQTLQLKKGVYNLSAWIKTEGVGSGNAGIRLQMDFRPGMQMWMTTSVINGTRDWQHYEIKNIVVPHDLTGTVKLENFAGATGTAWFDDVRLVEQQPQSVDVYLLHPNYRGMLFDDQSLTMRFDVTVTPPGGDFGRYTVRGVLRDEGTGQTLVTRNYTASPHFVADLDGSLMSYGRPYLATFALIDQSSGNAVYTYPAYRVSKVAGSARQSMNIAFDAKNRVLLHGKPRFVLGVYDSGGGFNTSDSFWENQIWSPSGARGLEGLRINMYLNYWMGGSGADSMKALMANLQKRGVMYLQTGNCFANGAAGNNFLINSSDAYVQDIGAHPGSAGYYTADECGSALIPGVFAQYQRLRRLDPDSMTFAALFGNADIRLWRDAADVLASDPYPMYAAEPAGGYNHRTVADWTENTREAVKDARPFMTVLQFFKFTSQGRWPTRQEMRNHAFMAIVEGARGLWWWSAGNGAGALASLPTGPERTGHLNNLKAVVGEIADLEPALLADDAPGALRGNSSASAIRTKAKVVNGKGYLFAYNYTGQTVGATFTWNTPPGAVTVNAENRTLAASGNSFTDTFGPYQAHVYVIGNGGSGGSGGGGNGGGSGPGPTSPTVAFTNPSSGATLRGMTTVSMSTSGGTAPLSYTVTVNSPTTMRIFSGTANSFSWNTASVPNGSHTLTATVTDSSGRTGTASRPITVANGATIPPTPSPSPPPATGALKVSVTGVTSGATVSGIAWPHVWVSGQSGTSNTFSVAINGQTVKSVTTSATHTVLDWDSRKTTDGTHTLTATVRDATGKVGTSSLQITSKNGTVAVPITPPSPPSTRQPAPPPPAAPPTPAPATPPAASGALKVSLTAVSPGATVSGMVWPHVWVSGQSGTSNAFSLVVNNQTAASVTTSMTHTVLGWDSRKVANGTYTLRATARDATGKTGSVQITVTVRN